MTNQISPSHLKFKGFILLALWSAMGCNEPRLGAVAANEALGPGSEAIDVEDFGALCDGTTNDSEAINDALDAVPEAGGDVVFPSRTCLIDAVNDPLTPKSRTRLLLKQGTVLKAQTNSSPGYQVILLNEVSDVTISGGTVEGDRCTHEGSTGEWGAGIFAVHSRKIKILGVTVRHTWGDGITLAAAHPSQGLKGICEDVLIHGTRIERARRNGISVIGVHRLVVDDTTIVEGGGTAPGAAIDFEAEFPNDKNEDAIVSNTIMQGNDLTITFGGTGTRNVVMSNLNARNGDGMIIGNNTENLQITASTIFATGGSGIAVAGYGDDIDRLLVTNNVLGSAATGVIVEFPFAGSRGTFRGNAIIVSAPGSRAVRMFGSKMEYFDNTVRVIGTGGIASPVSNDDWTHHFGSAVAVGGNRFINETSPSHPVAGIWSSNLKRDEYYEGGYARGLGGATGTQSVLSNSLTSRAFATVGGIGGGATGSSLFFLDGADTFNIVPFAQGGGENGCDRSAVGAFISAKTPTSFTLSYVNRCALPQSVNGSWIAAR